MVWMVNGGWWMVDGWLKGEVGWSGSSSVQRYLFIIVCTLLGVGNFVTSLDAWVIFFGLIQVPMIDGWWVFFVGVEEDQSFLAVNMY
ncbi:hypothetical protein GGS21DRAFT_525141 [Xylaria nigripes]|nr:hypothetical protein GGS21DRAFT_525141 [Xylaria nigripes]